MYEQKHINLNRFTGDKGDVTNVAFYGNKVVATDSFRLVEILAEGEEHEPRLFDGKMLKAVKVPKGFKMKEEDFGLVEKDGRFPDYMQLKKRWDSEEYMQFAVNADYLAEIVSQLGKLAKFKRVVIKVPKKYAEKSPHELALPIVIEAPDAKAFLMPMQLKD